MLRQELYSIIFEKYGELKKELGGSNIQRILELMLEVHALVHPAEVSGRTEKMIADYVFEYMTKGNQNTLVPREDCHIDLQYAGTKIVPMCWQFWHIYRIEDLISNILMLNQKQIFSEDWKMKIGSSITDTGNALEFEETVEFCKKINVEVLHNYMIAVGKNTREMLKQLTLAQLKSMPSKETLMRILEEGGVTTDPRSIWLLDFWGGLTMAGMVLTPLTDHHMMHLPPCLEHLPILD